MALYRTITLSFWNDNKIVDDFTPEDRYFYLYILTNPHTNLIGCYEISVKQMSYETGYNVETIKKLIERMQSIHQVIIYKNETKEILIKNWYKYNWTKSDKLIKNIEKNINLIKDDELKKIVLDIVDCFKNDRVYIGYQYPMHTSVTVTNTITNTNNINNNNKIKVIKKYYDNIELNNLFIEYLDLRLKLKCKNTDRAVNLLINKLNEYDDATKIEMLNNAIMNSWKSVYPIKEFIQNKKDSRKEINDVLKEVYDGTIKFC